MVSWWALMKPTSSMRGVAIFPMPWPGYGNDRAQSSCAPSRKSMGSLLSELVMELPEKK